MENSERSRLQRIAAKFSGVKVLVVGDLMLDRYWWGDVTRISPEAPVPIVRLRNDTYAAGGAANVAANIAGLGATVFLAGAIGADAEGAKFRQILDELHISTEHIAVLSDRPTTVKTRVIAHSQQIVRVDQEETSDLSEKDENMVWEMIAGVMEEVDLVIVSDYAKGLLTPSLLARLITETRGLSKSVLVDPKGKDYTKYKGATLLTPNRREASEACHLEDESQALLEMAGERLISELDLDAALITQGEEGMTLFQKESLPIHLGAIAREIYDVTGAGDTVIACMGAAMATGADSRDAATIANIGASMVIQHVGTTFVTAAELCDAIGSLTENTSGGAGSGAA